MTRRHKRGPWNEELDALPAFAGCQGRITRRTATLGTRVHVRAGQRLTTAGDRGAEVLVVLSGRATCLVGESEETQFGRGDFFGEVAALDGGPRSATVVAETEMDVLVFTPAEFEALVTSTPEVAHRMLKALAQRLRQANAKAAA